MFSANSAFGTIGIPTSRQAIETMPVAITRAK
jgi:hypothetical protein